MRTGGLDRYATAALLFTGGGYLGGTNNIAVIASGANFPDALSANYLAAGLEAGGDWSIQFQGQQGTIKTGADSWNAPI